MFSAFSSFLSKEEFIVYLLRSKYIFNIICNSLLFSEFLIKEINEWKYNSLFKNRLKSEFNFLFINYLISLIDNL